MLELTTRFSGITTSPRARGGALSAAQATGKAAAHLRYINRSSAVSERAAAGLSDGSPDEIRAELRDRCNAIAKRGGKAGARVLEKGVVSLPNSWDSDDRQAACDRIAAHLAPEGSEAAVLVVTHRDRSRNAHLHYAAVDGRESVEAARKRRPNAKRIRRQQVIGMARGGRPKELRGEIAGILNEIATERGLERVEWRSYADRGIAKAPGEHEGPRRRAIAEKTGMTAAAVRAAQRVRDWLSPRIDLEPIDELFPEPKASPRASPQKTPPPPSRAHGTPPATDGPPPPPARSRRGQREQDPAKRRKIRKRPDRER